MADWENTKEAFVCAYVRNAKELKTPVHELSRRAADGPIQRLRMRVHVFGVPIAQILVLSQTIPCASCLARWPPSDGSIRCTGIFDMKTTETSPVAITGYHCYVSAIKVSGLNDRIDVRT